MSAAQDRDLDVVLFGATGFVGHLTAEHLALHAPSGTRIGLAGRSRAKLEAVRGDLGPEAADWPLLVADAGDPATLERMVAATRVVATTVGPYLRHGLPLVAACAEAGTDYLDLTGELLFVRQSIDRNHAAARASGARIVHSCGFDSIPSDLAVLLLADAAAAAGDGELTDTTLLLVSARGGLSGGTIDSLRVQIDAVERDGGLRALLADPYALSPDRAAEPDHGDESDLRGIVRDDEFGVWTAPFVMAPHNTRIVRRSNALLGHRYGRGLRYREVVSTGSTPLAPVLAAAAAVGTAAATAAMAFTPARPILDLVLPGPGEGPSERARRHGRFRMEVRTRTTTGARYRASVAATGDPGYAATSVMLGQAALCLALERDALPALAGVLTPATGLGEALVARLRAAGMTFDVART
jgi:short subunit dehydrogenase-like uncharacterized protein